MHSTQLLSALALALSAFSVAHAAVPDVNVQAAMEHHLAKRQSGTASASASAPASSSASRPAPSSSSKTTPPATTTTPSTTSQSSTTAQTTPPSTSNTPPPPTSSSTVPSETSAHQATPTNTDKTPTETSSSSLPPRTTSTFTTTFVSTDPANGQVKTLTSEGTTVQTSGLASNDNGNNAPPSGLSVQNRNIIIGCVVGVGGAIILAVVGVVAWRVWGRKRNEETDGAFGTTYNPAEKPEQPGSQSSRTPFQSTLESYHAPTQVNTASNF